MARRIWQFAVLGIGALGSLAGCMFPGMNTRPAAPPVYLHVPCNTPGARIERSINAEPSASGARDSTKTGGGMAKQADTCVIERRSSGR